MEFPFTPMALSHKHGGTITCITGIGHEIDKPRDGYSRDYWHFYGTVQWRDGGKSEGLEIAPWAVCCDHDGPGKAEIDQLMQALTQYLETHGQYYDHASKHQGWYAHDRKARRRA